MDKHSSANVFVGSWSYRSFLNEPDQTIQPPNLTHANEQYMQLFGAGTITIEDAPSENLKGTIGGPGWQLELHGSRSYGNPMTVRFRGRGVVSGSEWIYDYVGYLVPEWINGKQQKTAMVGSIVRAINHPSSSGGVSSTGLAHK